MTFIENGGSGEFEITALNFEENFVSGTFGFSGKRLKRDRETLELVLDENGNTIIESLEISCGLINEIPFGDGGGGNEPAFFNLFSADVNGMEFMDTSVRVGKTFASGIQVININATSNTGKLIRIDIPIDQGIGTFDFEPISDGSALTAIFNNNNGAESLTANPGSITIVEFDQVLGYLEGTFSFTGTDPFENDSTTVEVTNGEFMLSFL